MTKYQEDRLEQFCGVMAASTFLDFTTFIATKLGVQLNLFIFIVYVVVLFIIWKASEEILSYTLILSACLLGASISIYFVKFWS